MYKELRCQNPVHEIKESGNLLFVVDKDSLYVKCNDRGCKRWTRITIQQPGVESNYNNAIFETVPMPEGFVFNEEIDGKMEKISQIAEG